MVAHFTMRTYGVIRNFDLIKAFGYIERVVKSDSFFGKYILSHYACATCSEQSSYIKTMANVLNGQIGSRPESVYVL